MAGTKRRRDNIVFDDQKLDFSKVIDRRYETGYLYSKNFDQKAKRKAALRRLKALAASSK